MSTQNYTLEHLKIRVALYLKRVERQLERLNFRAALFYVIKKRAARTQAHNH